MRRQRAIEVLMKDAPRFLLHITGAVLILGSFFSFTMGILEPHGRHGAGGLWTMTIIGIVTLIDGAGFFVPRLTANFLSALLLAGAGFYLFCTDAFVRENWLVYSLFVLPLLLVLLLSRGNKIVATQELANAN